jgi:hypothetical protein
MKPFSAIAVPHKDITEGRMTLDVFAADLWEVFQKRAPVEYKDSETFFRKTYMTAGLQNLLDIAQKRLQGNGGDSIIQLQTPFGGGKTHSLIALYHKAQEWNAKVIVIDGTKLDPKDDIPWEMIEKQLTGKVEKLKGRTSPGGEKLREILAEHQPVLVLIDEILEYTTKAAGIKVGDSNLASQVLAFTQELTGTINSLDKSMLILTLPASILEHYDEKSELLYQQLQKITGRMERVYTPVQEEEICHVISRRLFSQIDEKQSKKIITAFLDYAEKERILPESVERADYAEKFRISYPFQPEVIEVLYKRWGSFPTFQRTRGVLRLLSLVVHSLLKAKIEFISLGDIDLKNVDIKRELIKHIGNEFDSIIASDISSNNSGAKRVDKNIGDAYSSYSFGTKIATTIFMYSFSGGMDKGATITDIKLSSAVIDQPSSIITEVISKLKETLFYIQSNGKHTFTNQPNLNRILLTKMDGIGEVEIREEEMRLIASKENIEKRFETIFWASNPREVPDTKKLKLVIMQNDDRARCKEILDNYGERPRNYRNMLIFLCPMISERAFFEDVLKKSIAWKMVHYDNNLVLSTQQVKDIKEKREKIKDEVDEGIRKLYRTFYLPGKDDLREGNLGLPTYGHYQPIDKVIFERLKGEEILEKLSPRILKEKYLRDKDYVSTKNILEALFKTPGELRIVNDSVLVNSIKEGVIDGLFGLGVLEEDKPVLRSFETHCYPYISDSEVLINAEVCKKPEAIPSPIIDSKPVTPIVDGSKTIAPAVDKIILTPPEEKKLISGNAYHHIKLDLGVLPNKISNVAQMMNLLRLRFKDINVKIEIDVCNGEIAKSEYEDKIKEAISQAELRIEFEKLE